MSSHEASPHESQCDITIDIHQIEMSLRETSSVFIQKSMLSIELQRWKYTLWDVIREGNSESLIQLLLDLVSESGIIIQGLNAPIWEGGPPVLHIVARKRFEIPVILQLAELIPENELTIQDETGETILHVAIQAFNTPLAMFVLDKKPELAKIRDNFGRLPVQAAAGKQKKVVSFRLHQLTKHENLYQEGEESDVLLKAMSAGWFEMVLYILDGNPELEWHKMEPLLTYFVNEPRSFPSRTPLNTFQSCIYSYISVYPTEDITSLVRKEMARSDSLNFDPQQNISKIFKVLFRLLAVLLQLLQVPIKIWEKLVQPIKDVRRAKIEHQLTDRTLRYVCREIRNHHLTLNCRRFNMRGVHKSNYFDNSLVKSVFFLAAQNGIHEMVEQILEVFPEAIDSRNDEGLSALDLAAMYRHEKVFMIALEKGGQIQREMLFQVAENALQSLLDTGTRVVFQMQRELRWFKEMENLMPEQKHFKNEQGLTPIHVFREKHKELSDYETKWMTEMANSCIIGGSLIATVVFAASITVPGGNNNSSGLPIFLHNTAYHIYSVANTLSLAFSLTSVLIFLSISTARYSVNDYLHSLPTRIIFGLVFLFLAVTLVMVDFIAIAYLVSGSGNERSNFIIAASACIPVAFFGYVQLPSFVNMIRSTFGFHTLKVKVVPERHASWGDQESYSINNE
ncbi:scaffold/adaptor protein [Lithospermum erythrorhizon]|uniref:Scaffold/adaptor protein n=1 Tax=Lithospermum erythrorhizon TaxID=34254 RepID=A0AAV3NVY7_LITER